MTDDARALSRRTSTKAVAGLAVVGCRGDLLASGPDILGRALP